MIMATIEVNEDRAGTPVVSILQVHSALKNDADFGNNVCQQRKAITGQTEFYHLQRGKYAALRPGRASDGQSRWGRML
ncbi:hypothetical protein [Collimonas sp. OK412]|uniref:hypothetical protein n=1 Tax=Collimonas sp. (strain OK412) TaxID=1801619 RepID=UPI000B8639D4|nr:hypothetical protein [Collimonas sp. OK412]